MFKWENSHRCEFHTVMAFWFCIAFTWWLGHFISRYLKVHFMMIKYTCDSKSQTLRMFYPFQSTGRPISHWKRVVVSHLHDTTVRFRTGTRTGVHSRWGDSCQHDILWWYHVNKYRAMRGNRCELTPVRKSPRCHVSTPFIIWSYMIWSTSQLNFYYTEHLFGHLPGYGTIYTSNTIRGDLVNDKLSKSTAKRSLHEGTSKKNWCNVVWP